MNLVASWFLMAFGLWLTSAIVPGFRVNGFKGALVVGAIYGILSFLVGWLIFTMIGVGTLLLGFVFASLTWWITGAILLKITDALSSDVQIDSFGSALIASGVLTLLNALRTFFLH